MNLHDLAPCPGCGGTLTEHDMSDDPDRPEDAAWWGWYECPYCGWEMPDAKRRWTWGAAAEASPLVKLLLAEVTKLRAQGVDVWGEPAHGEDLDRG